MIRTDELCIRNELDKDIYISRLRWLSYIDAMKSAQAILIHCEIFDRLESIFFVGLDIAVSDADNVDKHILEMLSELRKKMGNQYKSEQVWEILTEAYQKFQTACRNPLEEKAKEKFNYLHQLMEQYDVDTWKEEEDEIAFQQEIKKKFSQNHQRYLKEDFRYLIIAEKLLSSLIEGIILLDYIQSEQVNGTHYSAQKLQQILENKKTCVEQCGLALIKKYSPRKVIAEQIEDTKELLTDTRTINLLKQADEFLPVQFKSWLDNVTSRKQAYKWLKEQVCKSGEEGSGIGAYELDELLNRLGFDIEVDRNGNINKSKIAMIFVGLDQLIQPELDAIAEELDTKELTKKEKAALREEMIREQTLNKVNRQEMFKKVFPIPELINDFDLTKLKEDAYFESLCFGKEMDAVTEGILSLMPVPHLPALNEKIHRAFACALVANTISNNVDKTLEVFDITLEDDAEDEEDWDEDEL